MGINIATATGMVIGSMLGPLGTAAGGFIGGLGYHLYDIYKKPQPEVQPPAPPPAPPPFRHVVVTDLASLQALHDGLWTGDIHPRFCAVDITGEMSQKVSKAYNALYKVRALRRRGEQATIAGGIDTAIRVAGSFTSGRVFDVLTPIAYVTREMGEADYRDDHFLAALCLPHADLVCSILVAGLHLALNDGEVVKLTAEGRRSLPARP